MKKVLQFAVVIILCIAAFALTKMTSVQIVNSTLDNSPVGASVQSTGSFTTLSASGAISSGSSIAASTFMQTPNLKFGSSQNISHISVVNFAGCTVSNSGDICNSTGTWSTAFVDNNYVAVCSPVGNTFSRNTTFWIDSQTASTITIGIQSVASNAGFNGVYCIGVHQ